MPSGLQTVFRWLLLLLTVGLLGIVVIIYLPQTIQLSYNDYHHAVGKPTDGKVTPGKPRPIQVKHRDEEVRFEDLLSDYLTRIQTMKSSGFWKANPPTGTCNNRTGPSTPCVDTNCIGNATSDPKGSLSGVLKSMEQLDRYSLSEVTRLLKPNYTPKKVVFVTAASSNHFLESQALIKNLHERVFPLLTNYSFVYYDIGLTAEERGEVERFCRCEVRTFPLWAMPPRLKQLTCYTWKPLIINANLPTAEHLVWTDASVRFKENSILTLLKELDIKGVTINRAAWTIGQHTTEDMMNYFGEKSCQFSHIPEPGAFFIMLKNDRFIRNAVAKPWAACALSPKCMCPENHKSLLICKGQIRKYGKCHRFDQSAIGIILVKLFRGHEVSVTIQLKLISVLRGRTEQYFDALQSQMTPKLLKNYT